MNRVFFSLIFFFLIANAALCLADDSWCGYCAGESPRGYPYGYGPSIRAKFIFIDFPGDAVELPVMHEELQGAVVESIKTWLASHSQNRFQFTEDTGIVFKYGDTFDDDPQDDVAAAWQADQPAAFYADASPPYDDPLEIAYLNDYAEIADWHVPGINLSALMAEILYKVHEDYINAPQDDWPLGSCAVCLDPPPDELKQIDLVIMVFMTKVSPYGPGVGGTPGISVNAGVIQSAYPQFFGLLKLDNNAFQGIGIQHTTATYDPGTVFKVDNCCFGILHEFAHTFDWGEAPPALQGLHATSLQRYYYGSYNVSSQHFIEDHGIPIIGLRNLATKAVEGEWLDPVVDFTGTNLKDEIVYDLRWPEDGKRGKIYKFRMENADALPQYFLFAFHGGQGVDAQLPARGLEVQHVVESVAGVPDIEDLESALGQFHEIGTRTLPVIDFPPDQGDFDDFGQPSAEWGFDNHDLWWIGDVAPTIEAFPNEADREIRMREVRFPIGGNGPGEYSLYNGQGFDFFTTETHGEDGWTAPEFSYRTNPSTYWYSDGDWEGDFYRFNRQDVRNSLFVRIREQWNDYGFHSDGIFEPHMRVDFLTAPYETVLEPHGGEVFQSGQVVPIVWTTAFGTDITDVDLRLYPTADQSCYLEIPFSEYVPGGNSVNWQVAHGQGTDENVGRIEVVFHNAYSSYVSKEMSGNFTVAAQQIPQERFLQPVGGETVIADPNTPYEIRWTAAYPSTDYPFLTLSYSQDGGANWEEIYEEMTIENGGYFYNAQGDYNWCTFTPTAAMRSGQGRLKLEFLWAHDGLVGVSEAHTADLVVYPIAARFADATAAIDAPPEHQPVSVVPIMADAPNGAVDVLVSVVADQDGPNEGVLYINQSVFGGALQLVARTEDYLLDNIFVGRFGSLAVADFDSDGDDDFFACAVGGEEAKLFRRDGLGFTLLENRNVFPPTSLDLLRYVRCASWIDYDHDYDLDLLLGRAEPSGADGLVLFAYDPITGRFDDVTAAGGLAVAAGPTTTVAWADFDRDNLWELVKGSGLGNGTLAMFEQVDATHFQLVADGVPTEVPTELVSCVRWADFDRDNDLDLLIVHAFDGNTLVPASSYVCYNTDGVLARAEMLPIREPGRKYACPLDYDLDGLIDLMITPSTDRQPFLLANLHDLDGIAPEFLDLSERLGLEATDGIRGAMAADLNRDGDTELFMGLANGIQGTLYRNSPTAGGELPLSNWIGFSLSTEDEDGQPDGTIYGATVALRRFSGEPLGVQIVDGGSGDGQQQPRDLVFGLGDLQEDLVAEVRWPNGWRMEFTVPGTQIGHVVDVVAAKDIQIDPASIGFTTVVHPGPDGSLIDWEFTWRTNFWTPAMEDKIYLTRTLGSCGFTEITLQDAPEAGIKAVVEYKVIAGVPCFEHRLIWSNQVCYPGCRCQFVIESGLGGGRAVVTEDQTPPIAFKVCPSSN